MARLPKKKRTAKKKTASRKRSLAPAKKGRRSAATKKRIPAKKKLTTKEMLDLGLIMAKRPAPGRRFMTTKDVQIAADKSERSAQRILQRIRKQLGKPKHSPVTVQEFCNYMAMSEKQVKDALGD